MQPDWLMNVLESLERSDVTPLALLLSLLEELLEDLMTPTFS